MTISRLILAASCTAAVVGVVLLLAADDGRSEDLAVTASADVAEYSAACGEILDLPLYASGGVWFSADSSMQPAEYIDLPAENAKAFSETVDDPESFEAHLRTIMPELHAVVKVAGALSAIDSGSELPELALVAESIRLRVNDAVTSGRTVLVHLRGPAVMDYGPIRGQSYGSVATVVALEPADSVEFLDPCGIMQNSAQLDLLAQGLGEPRATAFDRIRTAETPEERDALSTAILDARSAGSGWSDRGPASRSYLDEDLPEDLAARLSGLAVSVELVDDPDAELICFVTEQATAGCINPAGHFEVDEQSSRSESSENQLREWSLVVPAMPGESVRIVAIDRAALGGLSYDQNAVGRVLGDVVAPERLDEPPSLSGVSPAVRVALDGVELLDATS